ncbi:MAG: hypothetical protein ABWZ90_11525 [Acidimicrobiales bacterium]
MSASDLPPAARLPAPEISRWAVFTECPQCGGDMAPEHAHYRCGTCGWRDSCCD